MKRTISKCLVGVLALSGALVATATPSYALNCNHITIRQGATGHCVSDIQYILNWINSPDGQSRRTNYAPVPPQLTVDGIYGSATAFTVGHYEKWIPWTVDGIVEPEPTWHAFCDETAYIRRLSDPSLQRRQSALAAQDAGCHMI